MNRPLGLRRKIVLTHYTNDVPKEDYEDPTSTHTLIVFGGIEFGTFRALYRFR